MQCVYLAGFRQVFFKQKLLKTFGKIAPLATPGLRLVLICSILYDFAKDFIRCTINFYCINISCMHSVCLLPKPRTSKFLNLQKIN